MSGGSRRPSGASKPLVSSLKGGNGRHSNHKRRQSVLVTLVGRHVSFQDKSTTHEQLIAFLLRVARRLGGPSSPIPYASPNVDRWDKLMVFACGFELFAFPARLGVLDRGYSGTFALLDVLVDIVFAMDVCRHFLVTREVVWGDTGKTEELTTFGAVGRHYLSHGCAIDVTSTFAMHVVELVGGPDWLFWLAMAPRLVRVSNIIAFFRKRELNLTVSVRQTAMIKYVLLLFGVAHWTGLLWFFSSRLQGYSTQTLLGEYVEEGYKPGFSIDTSTLYEDLLLSMFWGLSGLTNFGYSGVIPSNGAELLYTVLVAIIQTVFYAYILATIFNYLVKRDESAAAYREHMLKLDEYCKQHRLPNWLRVKLQKHFDFQHLQKLAQATDSGSGMNEISLSLQLKVAYFQFSALANCYLFKGCDPQFTNTLMAAVSRQHLMPGELLVSKHDMSRSLAFVMNGSVEVYNEASLVQVLRGSPDDIVPVAEVGFFLGMEQPYSVVAQKSGAVELVVIHKDRFEGIMESYAEQMDIIVANLLGSFELDKFGKSTRSAIREAEGADEDDPERAELRESLCRELGKKYEAELGTMTYAASTGDLDQVRNTLASGLNPDSGDYDRRSTIHLAAAEGNLRVVKLLLEHGASVNVVDRWGGTPLQDAIEGNHTEVVAELKANNARLGFKNIAHELASCVQKGDLTRLQRLLESDCDPNAANYDGITAFHIAASRSDTLRGVELLLRFDADVNAKDRWGSTPLQIAVLQNNHLLVQLLRQNGGRLNLSYPPGEVCSAASENNIDRLRLLLGNGVDINAADYDRRTALHIASAEGRLQAVFWLVQHLAEVNLEDRWGGTALLDALDNGHWECAKLLQAAGGIVRGGHPDLARLDDLNIADVRQKLKLLGHSPKERVEADLPVILQRAQTTLRDADAACDAVTSVSRALRLVMRVQKHRQQVSQRRKLLMLPPSVSGIAGGVDPMLRAGGMEPGVPKESAEASPSKKGGRKPRKAARVAADLGEAAAEQLERPTAAGSTRRPNATMTTTLGSVPEPVSIETRRRDPTAAPVAVLTRFEMISEEDVMRGGFDDSELHMRRAYFRAPALELPAESDAEEGGVLGNGNGRSARSAYLISQRAATGEKTPQRAATGEKTHINSGSVSRRASVQAVNRGFDRDGGQDLASSITALAEAKGGLEALARHCQHYESIATVRALTWILKVVGVTPCDVDDVECVLADTQRANPVIEAATDEHPRSVQHVMRLLFSRSFCNLVLRKDPREVPPGVDVGLVEMYADELELMQATVRAVEEVVLHFDPTLSDNDDDDAPDGDAVCSLEDLPPQLLMGGGRSFLDKVFLDHDDLPSSVTEPEFRARIAMTTLCGDDSFDDDMEHEDVVYRAFELVSDMAAGLEEGEGDGEGSSVDGTRSPQSRLSLLSPVSSLYAPELFSPTDSFRRSVAEKNVSRHGANGDDESTSSTSSTHNLKKGSGGGATNAATAWARRQSDSGKKYLAKRTRSPWGRLRRWLNDTLPLLVPAWVRSLQLRRNAVQPFNFSGDGAEDHHRHHHHHHDDDGTASIFSGHSALDNADGRRGGKPQGTPWYILHPNSAAAKVIERVMLLFSTYYFFSVSFRIAFCSSLGQAEVDADPMASAQELLDSVADCIVGVCIASQFFVSYRNKRSVLVWSPPKIRKHYLAGGFQYDLVATVPLDLLVLVSGGSRSLVAWLRLPRVMHLKRVWHYFQNLRTDFHADVTVTGLKQLICLTIAVLHISACGWFYTAVLEGVEDSWFSRAGDAYIYGTGEAHGVLAAFYLCLYWVMVTLTTIGHGDMRPESNVEIVYTCVVLVLNLTVYAYILGEISDLIMKRDKALVETRSKALSLENYMSSLGLPTYLRNEIRGHMSHQASHGGSNNDDVYRSLSHSLQVQVAKHTTRHVLDGLSCFRNCSAAFLDSLSILLTHKVFPPDSFLFRTNEVCRELFIVHRGFVMLTYLDETGGDVVEGMAGGGEVCGDLAFFFGMRHSSCGKTGQTEGATVFSLLRKDYLDLIRVYKTQNDIVTENALANFTGTKTGRSSVSHLSSNSASSKYESEKLAKKIDEAVLKNKNDRICNMCSAAARGDLPELQRLLLADYVSVDSADYDGRTAMHLAAAEGHIEILQYLVGLGADINAQDRFNGTAVEDALRHKRTEALQFLVAHGGKVGESTTAEQLCQLAASGDFDSIRWLLRAGIDVNARDNFERSCLHLAAANGHLELCQALVEHGADYNIVDRQGSTPRQDAIISGHTDVALFLLSRGGRLGSLDVVCELCRAAFEGDLTTLQKYRDNEVALTEGDYDDRTALHLAASEGQLEVVNWMLKVSPPIDRNPVDRWMGTPYDDALREGHDVVAMLLKNAGGLSSSDSGMAARLNGVRRERAAAKAKALAERIEREKEEHTPEDVFITNVRLAIEQIIKQFTLTIAHALRLARFLAHGPSPSSPAVIALNEVLREGLAQVDCFCAGEVQRVVAAAPRSVRQLVDHSGLRNELVACRIMAGRLRYVLFEANQLLRQLLVVPP